MSPRPNIARRIRTALKYFYAVRFATLAWASACMLPMVTLRLFSPDTSDFYRTIYWQDRYLTKLEFILVSIAPAAMLAGIVIIQWLQPLWLHEPNPLPKFHSLTFFFRTVVLACSLAWMLYMVATGGRWPTWDAIP